MTEASQLDAILHAAAFAPITDRAFLRITGPDATRWLNGMVTNNIKDLAPGQGNYNFLLNAQGRIQGDCTIYLEPGEGEATFLLETDNSQLETVQNTLDKFIIMDDVELQPVDLSLGVLLLGPKAPELLDRFGYAAPEPLHLTYIDTEHGTATLLAHAATPVPQYELYARGSYNVANVIALTPEALEAYRIYAGTPRYGQDIRDKDLPQETAQTHALNFNKGCYLGQEIVERIHSRGNVHRTFTKFILTGDMPTLPAILEANAKPAGELTSAACIHDEKHGDIIYALGYLRREAQDQPLTYPGGTAVPRT
jgi:folate-binding protein YgfZ